MIEFATSFLTEGNEHHHLGADIKCGLSALSQSNCEIEFPLWPNPVIDMAPLKWPLL